MMPLTPIAKTVAKIMIVHLLLLSVIVAEYIHMKKIIHAIKLSQDELKKPSMVIRLIIKKLVKSTLQLKVLFIFNITRYVSFK